MFFLKFGRVKTVSLILLMLSIAAVSLLSGCAPGAAPSSGNTRVVTDVYGREVEVPEKPQTVAAIGGAARILTYAGCAHMLTGVTDMDKQNIPAMPYSVVNAGNFAEIASVGSGGSGDTPYIEELVMLAPDVIFGLADEQTIKNVAEKTGIPVIGIYPEGMFDETFYSALELIGQVMGKQAHTSELIEYMEGCRIDLDNRTKDIPDAEKPSVYTGAVSFRGAHGFEGTYAGYPPFVAINAKNVADETGQSGAFIIDLEKVTVWDPDIIFLNPVNMYLVNEHYGKNKAFYQGLKAVQNGKVYTQISYNYNWTNMEIAIADAYYAGKVIYPDRFADINPQEKADEIFMAMLGQPFYEKLAEDGSKFEKITIGE